MTDFNLLTMPKTKTCQKTGWSSLPIQPTWYRGHTAILTALSLSAWLAASPLVVQAQDKQNQKSLQQEQEAFVDANIIRVGISNDNMDSWEYPQTEISCDGPFIVKDKASGQTVLHAGANDNIAISVGPEGFSLQKNAAKNMGHASGAPYPIPGQLHSMNMLSVHSGSGIITALQGPLQIQPLHADNQLTVLNITRRKEKPSFKGALEIVRAHSSNNKLTVVNVVSLEDYLKAVVPNELPMRYGLEAVKAQAIAARNYALHPREKPWKTFDICDSQLCQVYLGAQTETPGSNKAVESTAGLIALYYGDPILALFSSAHGGYSENYAYAFSDPETKQYPAPTIPYLTGGPDIPLNKPLNLSNEKEARAFWTNKSIPSYDVNSPYYRWTKTWSVNELTRQINAGLLDVSSDSSTSPFVQPLFKKGQTIGTLKRLRVLQRGSSGKVMVLDIEGSHGHWVIQKEFLIRKVLKKNGRMLPSANVVFSHLTKANRQLVSVRADGGGFGHGVGLSQLGASWMHQHGYKFPDIIQHYYHGVSLGSVPIRVGDAGVPPKPIMSHFIVNEEKGMLWLDDEDGQNRSIRQQTVKVKINSDMLTLRPNGPRSGVDIGRYLKQGQLNTLVLFPDETKPQRRMRVWIDLYMPKPSS